MWIICSTKLLESLEPLQQVWTKNLNFHGLVTIFEGNQPHRDRDHQKKKSNATGGPLPRPLLPYNLVQYNVLQSHPKVRHFFSSISLVADDLDSASHMRWHATLSALSGNYSQRRSGSCGIRMATTTGLWIPKPWR
jgi:hypothetical protein